MADSQLTQLQADALFAMEKRRVNAEEWNYPYGGRRISIPLVSTDRREPFILDLSRARVSLAKGTYQNRVRQVVVLARLDFGGSPHRNPDGGRVGSPHLHRFREGFADKWAFPVPCEEFTDVSDPWRALHDFMRYCNITDPPNIQRGLGL